MACWNDLPLEVQWMILELLARDCSFATYPYARDRYASICRVWQPVFERRNFQQLVIDQWRLSDLDRILDVNRRRGHLEHLCFRLQLEVYGCPRCQHEESEHTMMKNNRLFTNSVSLLMNVLSKWPETLRRSEGLTLELAVFSPSDGQHIFRDFRLQKDYPYQELSDLEPNFDAYRTRADKLGLANFHDPYHGWVHGVLEADRISLGSRKRVAGELKYNFGRPDRIGLYPPKVGIVTTLLVRRQYYWKISLETLHKLLRQSLTSVRRFSYEGRQDVTAKLNRRTDRGYATLVCRGLPPALRHLSIFEEFNKVLHAEGPERRKSFLGMTFSKATRNLETFSASFVIDAENFFYAFQPTRPLSPDETPWANLRMLSLTTRTFHPGAGVTKINRMLRVASRAAYYMPKLELMQLWNGGEGFGYVFCYHGDPRASWMTWRYCSTGRYVVDTTTLRCWEEMERQRHPHAAPLRYTSSAFRGEMFEKAKTYQPMLRSLTNGGQILSPLSSYQAEWEEENPGLW